MLHWASGGGAGTRLPAVLQAHKGAAPLSLWHPLRRLAPSRMDLVIVRRTGGHGLTSAAAMAAGEAQVLSERERRRGTAAAAAAPEYF